MNYSKPEVAVLGTAAAVIELILPKQQGPIDPGVSPHIAPAYDLDE